MIFATRVVAHHITTDNIQKFKSLQYVPKPISLRPISEKPLSIYRHGDFYPLLLRKIYLIRYPKTQTKD